MAQRRLNENIAKTTFNKRGEYAFAKSSEVENFPFIGLMLNHIPFAEDPFGVLPKAPMSCSPQYCNTAEGE
ncbi:hypothetical protein HDU92_006613 [Lobulomyces angularis]|nr:hypothetical protein HDU92_006613 [Lobulomyces angularis]